MKKSLREYTDGEIERRLAFAAYIMNCCETAGKGRELPYHLEEERKQLCLEQIRRKENGQGDQFYICKD